MAEKSRRQAQELPKFATEQEEVDFWDTHDSAAYLGATEPVAVTFVDARPPKQQISLRLEPVVIEHLKKVAQSKGIGYQTLIRMWVMECLDQVGGSVEPATWTRGRVEAQSGHSGLQLAATCFN